MMDFTAIGAKRDREAEFYKLSCLGAIRFQIGRLSLSLSPLLFFWHLVCCRPAFYDAPIIRENAASAAAHCRPSIVHPGLPVKVERRARGRRSMLSPLDVLDDSREDFLSVVPMPDERARQRGSDMVLRGHPWIRKRILPD